jgi:hypothetical protein
MSDALAPHFAGSEAGPFGRRQRQARGVRIGPYIPGRVIDLTPAAFTALFDRLQTGLGRVNVKIP